MKELLDEVQRVRPAGLLRRRLRHRRDVSRLADYGAGVTNYLSVPDLPLDGKGTKFDFPGGTIIERRPRDVHADHDASTMPYFREERHRVDRARLVRRRLAAASVGRGDRSRSTRDCERRRQVLVGQGAALRRATPMQVGPLAQVLVGYAQGHEPTKRGRTKTLETAGKIAGVQADAGDAALDARPSRRAR